MADKQHRATFACHIAHFAQALFLELGIAHRQNLIHDQNLGVEVGGNGESQAHVHPAGVALDGCVDESFHA